MRDKEEKVKRWTAYFKEASVDKLVSTLLKIRRDCDDCFRNQDENGYIYNYENLFDFKEWILTQLKRIVPTE